MNPRENLLPDLKSQIRFLNANIVNFPIDIYINDVLYTSNLDFGKITTYKGFPPGEYIIDIYKSSDKSTKLFSDEAVFLPNSNLTISIVSSDENISLFILTDGSKIKSSVNSYLRFINLSPDSHLFSLSNSNDNILFSGVEYLETTNYSSITCGIHDFLLSETNNSEYFKTFIKNLSLSSGTYYTIYIVGVSLGKPLLGYIFAEDGK